MDFAGGRFRTALFTGLLLVIVFVGDGLPMKVGSGLVLQVMLVPITILFLILMIGFLGLYRASGWDELLNRFASNSFLLWLAFVFEVLFVCVFLYETRHFSGLGYRMLVVPVFAIFLCAIGCVGYVTAFSERVTAGVAVAAMLGAYVGGGVLAILSFPVNYLRSDMLPVIFWSDRALLAGGNAYQTFHVAERLYDFPYLPGMLLVFAPAQAMHVDLRWAGICYVVAGMLLVFRATLPEYRTSVAALIGLFVLNPYLQYRHELYTQGHFLSLIVIFVLMQRRRFAWSAAAFGVSMVISQFSWVIFPFFLMNGLRRGGWKEVGRMALVAVLAAAALMAPFLGSAAGNIAHNSVGQWDNLGRAIARPINLAFWVSYVVRPSHLKWIQLVLLTAIFCFCWAAGRCANLVDTLRWMIAALTIFILFNVLIDGYFYLMLLVPMLVYTCVASGWWMAAPSEGTTARASTA